MLSVLSLVALGSLEQCTYSDLDPTTASAVEDCSGNVNAAQCAAIADDMVGTCQPSMNGFSKGTCSGSSVKIQFHAKADCSDDASATCVTDLVDPTKAVTTGCFMTFTIDECETYLAAAGVMSVHVKFKGSCPAAEDEPCFSRDAEACRVLDTSVAPSAAFRACFDEPAPTVAERVKMTALTGGDYVLSAGKDQAYEFTRVIVNQHKLNEARHSHPRPPPPP